MAISSDLWREMDRREAIRDTTGRRSHRETGRTTSRPRLRLLPAWTTLSRARSSRGPSSAAVSRRVGRDSGPQLGCRIVVPLRPGVAKLLLRDRLDARQAHQETVGVRSESGALTVSVLRSSLIGVVALDGSVSGVA